MRCYINLKGQHYLKSIGLFTPQELNVCHYVVNVRESCIYSDTVSKNGVA